MSKLTLWCCSSADGEQQSEKGHEAHVPAEHSDAKIDGDDAAIKVDESWLGDVTTRFYIDTR